MNITSIDQHLDYLKTGMHYTNGAFHLGISATIYVGIIMTIFSILAAFTVQYLATFWPYIDPDSVEKKPRISVLRCVIHYLMIFASTIPLIYSIAWDAQDFLIRSPFGDMSRVLFMILCVDFSWYGYHRISHSIPTLWKRSHWEHHLETNPVSFKDSTLAHWTDWLASIVFDVFPLLLLRQSLFTFLVFGTWLPVQAQFNHCGRLFPKVPGFMSSVQHTGHHRFYNMNYCEHTTIPDWLFGTLVSHDALIERIRGVEFSISRAGTTFPRNILQYFASASLPVASSQKIQRDKENKIQSAQENKIQSDKENKTQATSQKIQSDKENKATESASKDTIVGFIGRKLWVDTLCLWMFTSNGAFRFLSWLWYTFNGGGADMKPIHFTFYRRNAVLVTNPEHMRYIVTADGFSLVSSPIIRKRFRQALPDNPVTVTTEVEWQILRHKAFLHLKGDYLRNTVHQMQKHAKDILLPIWDEAAATGNTLDIGHAILRYSSMVAFSWLFGDICPPSSEFPNELFTRLSESFDFARTRVFAYITPPIWLPTPGNIAYIKNCSAIDSFTKQRISALQDSSSYAGAIVRSRTYLPPGASLDEQYIIHTYGVDVLNHIKRKIGSTRSDEIRDYIRDLADCNREYKPAEVDYLLSRCTLQLAKKALEKAKIEVTPESLAKLGGCLCKSPDAILGERRALNETRSMLIGATETTILQIQWTIIPLSSNSLEKEKLYKTIQSIPTHEGTSIPKDTWADLQQNEKAKRLIWAVKEGLRLGPPPVGFNRRVIAEEGVVLPGDNVVLPKDTVVWGSQYLSQRDKRVWGPDADEFRADRWESPTQQQKNSFMPFLDGRRKCVGEPFALNESMIVFSLLYGRYNIELSGNKKFGIYDGLTIRPDKPIIVKLSKRP